MTVAIAPRDDAEARAWATALEVAALFVDVPWILVGAQMVMLLEHEAGRPSGRMTGDVDAIVDVRALAGGTRTAAARLVGAGFAPATAEHPYRFVHGRASVDLLAPDHLGRHVDLTTIAPAVTTAIPGGSRALATRRMIDVDVDVVGVGVLPSPLDRRAAHRLAIIRHAEEVTGNVSKIADHPGASRLDTMFFGALDLSPDATPLYDIGARDYSPTSGAWTQQARRGRRAFTG